MTDDEDVVTISDVPVFDQTVKAHGHYSHRVSVLSRCKNGVTDYQLSLNVGPMETEAEAVELAEAMIQSMQVMLDVLMPTKGNA